MERGENKYRAAEREHGEIMWDHYTANNGAYRVVVSASGTGYLVLPSGLRKLPADITNQIKAGLIV